MSRSRDRTLWGLATTTMPEVSIEAALREAVQGLTSLPGVLFIMVVSSTGSELLRWYRTGLDEKRMGLKGPDVLDVLNCMKPFLEKAKSGAFKNAVVRTESNVIAVQEAGRGFLLAVADSSVNLAMFLVRIRDAASRVANMLP